MKLIALTFAALSALTAAQGYYDVQSAGFRLIIKSSNSTLNGTALGACHQGAATEGLCPTGETLQDPPSSYTTFYHNVSSAADQKPNATDANGILSWVLRTAGNLTVPSAMNMAPSLSSNVVNPTFFPGTSPFALIAFEQDGCTYVSVVQDDTVSPPVFYNPARKVKNWYICLTRWSYLYQTLSWKVGVTGQPQNPSCQKVDVIRVFN